MYYYIKGLTADVADPMRSAEAGATPGPRGHDTGGTGEPRRMGPAKYKRYLPPLNRQNDKRLSAERSSYR